MPPPTPNTATTSTQPQSQRADTRANNAIRPPRCELATLERADGSARFDWGDRTRVLVGVYGPVEVKQRDELINKATVQVVFRPLVGLTSPAEKTYECAIRNSLIHVIARGLHPRTLIEIVAQSIGEDGSTLAAAINASTLALLDAGVPMLGLIAALTCAISESGDVVLDPSLKESKAAASLHTFAFDSESKGVVLSESTGVYSEAEYTHCLQICRTGSEKIFEFMRRAVRRRMDKVNGMGGEERVEADGDVAMK